MKFFYTALLFALLGLVASKSVFQLDQHFESFKIQHKRTYGSAEEEALRRSIFANNFALITEHNFEAAQGRHSFTLGVNRFADMTNEEFRGQFLGGQSSRNRSAPIQVRHSLRSLPDSVDWTTKGVVTPVKDQGQMGSAVAFGTVATIESAHAIKTGALVSLSEAQVEDCCGSSSSSSRCGGFQSCNPMSDDDAFKCVIKSGGLDTESSYPTPGTQCSFNPNTIGATIAAYVDIGAGDESALQAAVALSGPVAVEFDASLASFQFYASGVYNDPACTSDNIDHAGAVVGYGTDSSSGAAFWKVKNSWGVNWGESGYIRMSRNKQNQCGIASIASYPVV